MERYSDCNDIRRFCRKHRLDGLELLPYGNNTLGVIPADMVVGVHLSFFNSWVDFWNRNEAGVLAEFGAWETAEEILGSDRQALVDRYKAQLDFAESLKVEYVVFHVSDVSIAESVSYMFSHTDVEVIDTALELINAILDGGRYSFRFLVENLWWPGFTMTFPNMTRRLLDGIGYDRKGIMLDVGHLLHTNNALRTEKEGLGYIHTLLDAHGSLCDHIKGIHLHQSLTGAYVQALIANPPTLAAPYYDRFGQIYEHIHKIDAHEPFTAEGVSRLIERINPDYLTYEFSTRSRAEHEDFLSRQIAALTAV
jgi:sugar phosphate isomerase/epimerase